MGWCRVKACLSMSPVLCFIAIGTRHQAKPGTADQRQPYIQATSGRPMHKRTRRRGSRIPSEGSL